MPTIFTHALTGAVLAQITAPSSHRRVLTYAASIAAVLPDADVIGIGLGIPYGDMLGHRGLTHSLLFACMAGLAGAAPFWANTKPGARFSIALCLTMATASHGILDAFTNGGRGVAFFAPFSATRFFFPATPIEVSPLGLTAIFSARGMSVLASELAWVWCPALLLAAMVGVIRNRLIPR